jgi:ABC-2 type transport system permease protein
MDKILTIFKKEFKSYFYSPVAYILIIAFVLITSLVWLFTPFAYSPLMAGVVTIRGAFDNFLFKLVLIIFIPAITMRAFSEEKKSGTIELLLTKPVSEYQVIWGKYLAAFCLAFFAIFLTLIFAFTLMIFLGPIDIGALFSTYLGLFLLCAMYVAIGIFASSVTEYQVIAFIIGFFIIAPLFLFNMLLVVVPTFLVSIVQYISSDFHYANMSRGVIDTKDVIYFLSGILIFLMLTRISLEKRKW